MIYVLYYSKTLSPGAPAKVNLDDYKLAGTVKAGALSEMTRKWRNKQYVRSIGEYRALEVGDLAKTNNLYYILTPNFQWASVEILSTTYSGDETY